MRINLYTEEFEGARVEIVTKVSSEGRLYKGLRIYITTPVTTSSASGATATLRGRWQHSEDDDDTSAVTFWGLNVTRELLQHALGLLQDTLRHGHTDGQNR